MIYSFKCLFYVISDKSLYIINNTVYFKAKYLGDDIKIFYCIILISINVLYPYLGDT